MVGCYLTIITTMQLCTLKEPYSVGVESQNWIEISSERQTLHAWFVFLEKTEKPNHTIFSLLLKRKC
jgi:hypothetical protein